MPLPFIALAIYGKNRKKVTNTIDSSNLTRSRSDAAMV